MKTIKFLLISLFFISCNTQELTLKPTEKKIHTTINVKPDIVSESYALGWVGGSTSFHGSYVVNGFYVSLRQGDNVLDFAYCDSAGLQSTIARLKYKYEVMIKKDSVYLILD